MALRAFDKPVFCFQIFDILIKIQISTEFKFIQ